MARASEDRPDEGYWERFLVAREQAVIAATKKIATAPLHLKFIPGRGLS
jgi:hypothetical protein